MNCDPDCTCRGQLLHGEVITPGAPGYDEAVARALDLVISAPTQPEEREPQ